MKKHRIKKYLQLGIFIFGISLILINCERDFEIKEDIIQEDFSKLTVRTIDLSEVERNAKVFGKIKSLVESSESAKYSRDTIVNNEYDFYIDTDKVKYVENGIYNSYNFEVIRENPEDGKLENLFLTLNADYEYEAFIIKYDFTREELNNMTEVELNNRTTQYTPIDFDSSIINGRNFQRFSEIICESQYQYECWEDPITGIYGFEVCGWVSEIVCTGGGGPGPGPSTSDDNWSDDPNDGVDTSNENGGQGGSPSTNGSPGSSGSPPYSAPNCVDCPEIVDFTNECNKIDSLFINNPTLKQKLITLKSLTGASTERGKYKLNSTTLIQNMPVGDDAQVDMPIPTGTQKYEMIAHTHNAPASATYSVFSFEDILAMNTLLRLGKIDVSKFTAFLMTADGTNYAFTINNSTQFLKVFATKFDADFDSISAVNRYNANVKYYRGDQVNNLSPLIIENSSDNLKDEKLFLEFLKDANMGLSLFEVNDTFDSYEMVTYNSRTDSIIKQNCN